MWQTRQTIESNGRVIKLAFHRDGLAISRLSALELLRDDAEFRSCLVTQLSLAPFVAFRWETPAITLSSAGRDFECVILDSPGLARTPDRAAFSTYFSSHAVEDVAVFPNLGNDAMMIVPCPVGPDSTYGHLAAFVRSAPPAQWHTLFGRVGETVLSRLGERPIWLSTAGAGVSWLHVRLDSSPKYYGYQPYKTASPA
ncbi:MAG: hypothetical protein AB7O62_01320 [Pirellulales bacterium]